jgi:hypothetical protein
VLPSPSLSDSVDFLTTGVEKPAIGCEARKQTASLDLASRPVEKYNNEGRSKIY